MYKSFKKRNCLPVNLRILSSNRYAINLQDPVIIVHHAIVSNDLGLLHDIHWEDRQTELINVEANRDNYIPTIVNSN
jgi:hypothetical protein